MRPASRGTGPEARARPADTEAQPASGASARPPSVRRLASEARRAILAGRTAEARKLIARLETLPGGRVRALTLKALLLFQQGRYKDAARAAVRAVGAGGGTRARLVLADSYFRLGLYRAAAVEYEKILKRHPGHRAAQAGLRAARRRLGGK